MTLRMKSSVAIGSLSYYAHNASIVRRRNINRLHSARSRVLSDVVVRTRFVAGKLNKTDPTEVAGAAFGATIIER